MKDSLRHLLDATAGRPARSIREKTHGAVACEILAEMGSAFARANEKVDVAMKQLDRLSERLERHRASERGPTWQTDGAALAAAVNEQRERARVALWELRVHREALGINDHRSLDATYTLPPIAEWGDEEPLSPHLPQRTERTKQWKA